MVALSRFRDSPLGEVLTLRAFKPPPRDPTLPLRLRLRGQPLLLVALGSRSLRLAVVRLHPDRIEGLQEVPLLARPSEDQLPGLLRSWVEAQPAPRPRHALVLLSSGWTAELVEQAVAGSAAERVLWSCVQPERVLGKPPRAGCRQVVVPHPSLAGAVVFSVPVRAIDEAVAATTAAGFEVVRMRVPIAALLERLCFHHAAALQGADLLLADPQSALHLGTDSGPWTRLRFSSNRPGELAADIAKYLRDRPAPEAPLLVAGDASLPALVLRVHPGLGLAQPLGAQSSADLEACCHD